MAGTLILCATPIGNLGDASPRLAETLAAADLIYAEDTRRSRVLLSTLDVVRPVRSYFAGNEAARSGELRTRLEAGDTVALITDAGMPGISNPGYSAVRAAEEAGASITVVPGPSAVTAALAVSGLPADRFVFEGFLPRKAEARAARIEQLAADERTLVLFAATGRVASDLRALADGLGADRPATVVRELTKAHEEVWRGTIGEAADEWAAHAPRGEFTLVIAGAEPAEDMDAALEMVARRVAGGVPMAEAVREVAAETGTRRRRLYEAALRLR